MGSTRLCCPASHAHPGPACLPIALPVCNTPRRLPWLGIIYMGCGVTNGGLIMEIIALQVG